MILAMILVIFAASCSHYFLINPIALECHFGQLFHFVGMIKFGLFSFQFTVRIPEENGWDYGEIIIHQFHEPGVTPFNLSIEGIIISAKRSASVE